MPQLSDNSQARPGLGSRLALCLAFTGVLLALGWLAWERNLARACLFSEWPELTSCTALDQTLPARAQALHQRIERNPGDSEAWIKLAFLASQSDSLLPGPNYDAVLDTATKLAGEDPRVQRMQAVRAVKHQQWAQAVEWLIKLVQDSDDANAAIALANLVREPLALTAMQNHIKPDAHWLEAMIRALPQARVPVAAVMPLVVRALPQQGLSPELIQQLLRQLKADGQWLEAHALWLGWLGRPAALVYNGDFSTGFIPGGFDWEITPALPSKAGAMVRQVALPQHGGVLQLDFTGRPLAVPVVRHHLVLLHNHFVLSGRFMTASLQTNEGLAWVVACAAGGHEIARTPALKDTARQWKAFSVEFEIPSVCGNAVALQLQSFAPYEAAAGLRGQATFDDLKLEVLP